MSLSAEREMFAAPWRQRILRGDAPAAAAPATSSGVWLGSLPFPPPQVSLIEMLQAKRGEATVGLLCDLELHTRQSAPECGWAEQVVRPVPNTFIARLAVQQQCVALAQAFTPVVARLFQAKDMKAHLSARCMSTAGAKSVLAARLAAAEAADLMMKEGLIRIEAERARRFPQAGDNNPVVRAMICSFIVHNADTG
eukprot:SAG11_NODE_2659_length_3120_cov_2.024164_2_plen_196_part_00